MRLTSAGWSCALALGALLTISATATAETEQIGPLTLVPGQPVDLWYPNELPPDPFEKVLQFLGEAESFSSTGTPGILEIAFDYDDPVHGQGYMSMGQFAIPPGGPVTVSAGPWILPFCPESVSIHFEVFDTESMRLQGIFDHTCVPEPTSLLMIVAGLLLRRR